MTTTDGGPTTDKDRASDTKQDQGSGSGYAYGAPFYRQKGWRGVLPLPKGAKEPPPPDWTGRKAGDRWPTYAEVDAWAASRPDANLALRLPPGVLGIDVDAYDGKQGGESLAKLEANLGTLPRTVYSTSRPDDLVSGVRLFRATLPPGRRWKEKKAGPGIELLHDSHRYVAAWPSIHPEGRPYQWFDAARKPIRPPGPEDPAELPADWVLELSEPDPEAVTATAPSASDQGGQEDPFDAPGARTFTREAAVAFARPKMEALAADLGAGSRNNRLNDAAITLNHFVPAFWTETEATVWLVKAAAKGGYPDSSEVRATIRSGLEAKTWKAERIEDQAEAESPDKLQAEALARIVDLGPYLDGTHKPVTPSVGGRRSDGLQMLYPERWHTCIALTAAGKSWFALWHALAVLEAGGTVVYLHFEEASPALTLGRLKALGVAPEVIRTRFRWLDCADRWRPELYEAVLGAVGEVALVILDGINAACSQHGWHPNDDGAVGAYRLLFEKPATRRGAAVLSLGHPPKALDRQTKRHGYGATGWLDQAEGVGFRLEATKTPIRRRHRGASRLYSVKDRDDQVQQHGQLVANREGWWYLGDFVLDDTPDPFAFVEDAPHLTRAEVIAPAHVEVGEADGDADTAKRIELAEAIVAYLETQEDGAYSSQRRLFAGLRSKDITFDDELGREALATLEDAGRLQPTGRFGRRLTAVEPEPEKDEK